MQRLRWRHLLAPALALLAALVIAGPADAHKLGAECRLHDGRVELEAYYDDDTPARDAHISVLDAEQQLVAEGRTDAKGCWSFAAPQPGSYVVTVDGGAGHRTHVNITLPSTSASTAPQQESACGNESASVTVSEGPHRAAFTGTPWMNLAVGVAILGGVGGGFWLARRIAVMKTS